jgi:hypothetical protein
MPLGPAIMAAKKSRPKTRPTDTGKLLIHAFRNCVHQIHMEIELAERGLDEKFKYAELMSALDFMNRSLEVLRVRLVRMKESRRGEKSIGDL